MHCYLQLKLFGKQQRIDLFLDAECRNDVTSHNKAVKKNKLILRQFNDAVCYLMKDFGSGAMIIRTHLYSKEFLWNFSMG